MCKVLFMRAINIIFRFKHQLTSKKCHQKNFAAVARAATHTITAEKRSLWKLAHVKQTSNFLSPLIKISKKLSVLVAVTAALRVVAQPRTKSQIVVKLKLAKRKSLAAEP